jgi:hypothetical protein
MQRKLATSVRTRSSKEVCPSFLFLMLFTAKFHTVGKQQNEQTMDDVAVVSMDMLRSIRNEVNKKPTNKAAILDVN